MDHRQIFHKVLDKYAAWQFLCRVHSEGVLKNEYKLDKINSECYKSIMFTNDIVLLLNNEELQMQFTEWT